METGQLNGTDIIKFVLAGNATFTLKNTNTGNRFTFRIRQPNETTPHFVSVLTGPDNISNYVYLGTVFESSKYAHGRKSPITPSAQSAKTISWFLNQIFNNRQLPQQIEVYHEGHCGRCGRLLTVPESIQNGIGPVCMGKV